MPKRKKSSNPIVDGLAAFERTLDKALALAATDPDALPGVHETQGNPMTLGPRVPEAADWADKQTANAEAASELWLKNVQRPKKNPIAAALKANTKYKAKMQESIAQDKFAKGLQKVDEDEMYAIIAARGSESFRSGVAARAVKVKRVVGDLRNRVVALTSALDAMPVDTDAQREAKMLAAKRGMQKIGKDRHGIS